jgi:hypothetical protein
MEAEEGAPMVSTKEVMAVKGVVLEIIILDFNGDSRNFNQGYYDGGYGQGYGYGGRLPASIV